MTENSVALIWQDQLTQSDMDAVLALHIDEQQVEYAGTTRRAVEASQAGSAADVKGVAIFVGDRVVGFFVLKRRSQAPEWANPNSAVICHFRIDMAWQGKGLGSRTLKVIPGWIREYWPDIEILSLAVDEENLAGRKAYERAGFVDHGERTMGRIGWVRYMSRPIGD